MADARMRAPSSGAAVPDADAPIGILACAGALPLEIARLATARGRRVHIIAIDGFADPAVKAYPHDWVGLGQLARLVASFRRAGCREMVIAGGMRRPDLLRLKPDWGLVRYFPTILSLTRGGDDSVLRRIVRFFESEGFVVRGAGEVAPELLASDHPLGSHVPSAPQRRAIDRASHAILALGAFDIGQAAVATPDRVIALEGARGTDAMLASLASQDGRREQLADAVLVKLAKPGQELRIDLPTIGPRTVDGARAAGLSGIAVGHTQAITLEREVMIAAADAAGMFVTGIEPPEAATPPVDPRDPATMMAYAMTLRPLTVMARRAPTPSERRDIAIGRRLMAVLAEHELGRAAVIARDHVLAVSASLPVPLMIASLGRDSQWGRRRFSKQIGILLLDTARDASLLDLAVFQAAADAKLAGIACLGAPLPSDRRDEIVGWANDGRMFLLSEEPPDA